MSYIHLIDTHAHLTFTPLSDDVEKVLSRSILAGVPAWITVGTDPADNKKALELIGRHDNLYAALGFHPHDAKNITDAHLAELKESAPKEKIVAVGETGLDFHYNFSKQDDQKRIFRSQLEIAAELDLPVIIHSRNAFEPTMQILTEFEPPLKRLVFHCFSYSAEQAKTILDRGWHISFTGVVTFKNAAALRETAKLVPLDRLMVETDCPYMSPEPVRKQKVNEPALLIHTARKLAELKQMDLPDFCSAVTKTSTKFFNLPR